MTPNLLVGGFNALTFAWLVVVVAVAAVARCDGSKIGGWHADTDSWHQHARTTYHRHTIAEFNTHKAATVAFLWSNNRRKLREQLWFGKGKGHLWNFVEPLPKQVVSRDYNIPCTAWDNLFRHQFIKYPQKGYFIKEKAIVTELFSS